MYYIVPGTLWNLSSHDSVKMEIVDHALHALADEVVVPHSGWERGSNGGEESCKPRHLEWETALTNTAGCLRYTRGSIDWKQKVTEGERVTILRRKRAILCLNISLCPTGMWVQNAVRPGESWENAQDWWIHSCTLCNHRSTAKMWITRYLFTYARWWFYLMKPKHLSSSVSIFDHIIPLSSLPAVGGELCLPPEESVLSRSPWSPRQWALCRDHTPQPGVGHR